MIELNTYKDFHDYIDAFKKKKMNLLVVLSRGGLAKSYTVEEALIESAPLIFSGHVTPLSMYYRIYERTVEDKECFVIFDDVDTLVANKSNVSLLKQICDSREEKIIRYASSTQMIKDLPPEYETKCKVILLTNHVRYKDPNVEAFLSRGHLIYFNPPNSEIVRELKTWGKEKDIIEFMEQFAFFSKNLNMRTYKMAEELKASKLDWQKFVVQELKIDLKFLYIHKLIGKYNTDIERIKEYEEVYKLSRSDYYRYKKLYESHCKEVPKNP
jgi:hypothetical protein